MMKRIYFCFSGFSKGRDLCRSLGALSEKPANKNTPTLAFPPWQKVARRCPHGEGGIWSRKAPSQNKTKQKNQQKQPDRFPVPRAALSRWPSASARGLGGAQSGRGRGAWRLGPRNTQSAASPGGGASDVRGAPSAPLRADARSSQPPEL